MINSTNLCVANFKFESLIGSKYFEIFKKNLVLGYNVGAATITANNIETPKLYENAFLNRMMNLGAYNALQDIFFVRSNTDAKGIVDNVFYLGVLQTVKYVPNLITQNIIRKTLHSDKELSIPMKFAKNFLVVSTGMKVFFTVGAIENKISDDIVKSNFIMISSGLLFASYILTGPLDSKFIKSTEETHLSLNGYVATTIGLIGSFLVPDVMHRVGIDKGKALQPNKELMLELAIDTAVAIISGYNLNLIGATVLANQLITKPLIHSYNIDLTEFYGYNALDIASLTIMTAATIIQGNWVNSISMLLAFADAKAEAVTGIEIAYDYKEEICANFILKPACEYIGVIDVNSEEEIL